MNAAVMIHSQVTGDGPQVPGSGVQHQGQVQDPHLVPEPDNPYLIPDCRDLRPEDVSPSQPSGFPMLPPLSAVPVVLR